MHQLQKIPEGRFLTWRFALSDQFVWMRTPLNAIIGCLLLSPFRPEPAQRTRLDFWGVKRWNEIFSSTARPNTDPSNVVEPWPQVTIERRGTPSSSCYGGRSLACEFFRQFRFSQRRKGLLSENSKVVDHFAEVCERFFVAGDSTPRLKSTGMPAVSGMPASVHAENPLWNWHDAAWNCS
jgi:hypothetical protein